MYRSLYSFRSAEPNSLHFAAGESFLILERSNKHWWLGSRCTSGETGYIPASYIEKIQVKQHFVLTDRTGVEEERVVVSSLLSAQMKQSRGVTRRWT